MASYGETTESPIGRQYDVNRPPMMPGTLGSNLAPNMPVMPPEGRVAELCSHLTQASQELAVARANFYAAQHRRDEMERTFAQIAEALMNAIQTQREGAPEGVPYIR